MRATDLLALMHVPRWAIVPVGRPQSVAEHTFGVMVILLDLPTVLDLGVPTHELARCLRVALTHDGDEAWSGDLPGPFKGELTKQDGGLAFNRTLVARGCDWTDAEIAPYPTLYRLMVKLADLIEALVYLTKWGVGQHSKSILRELEHDITALVYHHWSGRHGHVSDYITQLLNEEGRL